MQDPVKHREIGFADLFRILLKKFYVILIATVLAAALGATYAYSKNKDVTVYGATAKYRISVTSQLYVDDVAKGGSSGHNYLYKEEHLSMLVDDLQSDAFVSKNFVSELVDTPYDQLQTEEERNDYLNLLLYVKSCITYSYNSAKNPNAISVTVRANSKANAETIFELVQEKIPAYIIENMIKPAPEFSVSNGTTYNRVYTTHCNNHSIVPVRLLSGATANTSMLKYAVLAGFLAAMIACITVIVLDYTDTRLRDPEDFADRIGVRILGVIPENELPQQSTEVQA